MMLERLCGGIKGLELHAGSGIDVVGLSHDSRLIREGMIFAALEGEHFNGMDFLGEALGHGAVAVLSREAPPGEIPWIRSDTPRIHMADLAWNLAGRPDKKLLTAGITGTNGKSTVGDLLHTIFTVSGRPASFVGTLGTRLPSGRKLPGERTTPEAPELASIFRQTVEEDGRAVVMEVSSHALDQERLHGLRFDVAVFTNLSRDHLDYHEDLESYFQSKKKLFSQQNLPTGRMVLPIDDPWGRRLAEIDPGRVVSWGENEGLVRASEIRLGLEGTSFRLLIDGSEEAVEMQLIGRHNLRNALAAAAAAHALGINLRDIRAGLNEARPLPGRLERVVSSPFPVFIDYAHTPDGLRAVLKALGEITHRKILLVFGAGGDRDRGKRPLMGRAVAEAGVHAILSSDNPRTEDPASIAEDVAEGLREGGADYEIVLDRREAIARALEISGPDFLLVVAGKGHETEQIIGTRRIHFSDRETILEILGGAGS